MLDDCPMMVIIEAVVFLPVPFCRALSLKLRRLTDTANGADLTYLG